MWALARVARVLKKYMKPPVESFVVAVSNGEEEGLEAIFHSHFVYKIHIHTMPYIPNFQVQKISYLGGLGCHNKICHLHIIIQYCI